MLPAKKVAIIVLGDAYTHACTHCSILFCCSCVLACGLRTQVVVVLGSDLNWAAEGHDATSITLSDAQLALVGNVSAAAKKPVVVVMMTATPLDLTPLLSNDKVRKTS